MIFQHFNLISGSTIAENVAFALHANHYPKEKIRKSERTPRNGTSAGKSGFLSGQLKRRAETRVAIARALANDPKILLCDEATSALDLENTEEIVSLLKEINEKYHITIVFITHEMEVAKKLFDRIAFMENGEIKEVRDIYSAFAEPREEITKSLVERVLNVGVPDEVKLSEEEELVKLCYTGEKAYASVISQVSKQFDVVIDIINGKIDYIHGKPLGVLIVIVRGRNEEREKALRYMKENVYRVEELEGGR